MPISIARHEQKTGAGFQNEFFSNFPSTPDGAYDKNETIMRRQYTIRLAILHLAACFSEADIYGLAVMAVAGPKFNDIHVRHANVAHNHA